MRAILVIIFSTFATQSPAQMLIKDAEEYFCQEDITGYTAYIRYEPYRAITGLWSKSAGNLQGKIINTQYYFDEVKATGKGNQRVLRFRGGTNWREFISAGNYLKVRDGNDMLFYYAKCNRTN